jgi:tRNA-splicing endonuclease subunit Sen34
MHLRRAHNMCDTLIGNIPQSNQQNIFFGVPLQLMRESARLLVEQGHAYIVDDTRSHLEDLQNLSLEERARFKNLLGEQSREFSRSLDRELEARRLDGLARKHEKEKGRELKKAASGEAQVKADESLFETPASASPSPSTGPSQTSELPLRLITPTTSYPPLRWTPSYQTDKLPPVPSSYPLFAYLHSKGYFMLPGLRFGCHYSCYPGDPLRFHSHWLAVGYDWDEEIDLLDTVGAGRLGTGVKKAYLIGGVDPDKDTADSEDDHQSVRTFCFEWAAM